MYNSKNKQKIVLFGNIQKIFVQSKNLASKVKNICEVPLILLE